MKRFEFPVLVRSNRHATGVFSEIVLGRVRIVVKDRNSLVAVQNDEDAYIMDGTDFNFLDFWAGKGQIVHKVHLLEIAFNLNRMLLEQGREIIEPIMDDMLVRKHSGD